MKKINSFALSAVLLVTGCKIHVEQNPSPGASPQNPSASKSGAAGQVAVGGAAGNSGAGGSEGGTAGIDGAAGGTPSSSGAGGETTGVCGDIPASGRCVGDLKVQYCLSGNGYDKEAYVSEQSCPAGWSCVEDEAGAKCKNPNPCTLGDSRCLNFNTVEVCSEGGWVPQPCDKGICKATGNLQASCVIDAAGEAETSFNIQGRLLYEFRLPKENLTGLKAPQTDGAYSVLIAAWHGDEYAGGATSDPEGYFSLQLNHEPGPDTKIYAFPMSFDQQGQPLAAVAYPPTDNPDTGSLSPGYWSFKYPYEIQTGSQALSDWTITEAQGSGSIWVFQWMEYSLSWLRNVYPNAPQPSIVAFWQPELDFKCGSCAFPPDYGLPTQVALGGNQYDTYASRLQIGGSTNAPDHWMRSVLAHEIGHYVMGAYSGSTHEGGAHTILDVSSPGLAYSEGWATFWGQRLMSDEQLDPIFFSVGGTGTYWFHNIDTAIGSSGTAKGGDLKKDVDQKIGESLVSWMLWHMWAPTGKEAPNTYGNFGDSMMSAFASERLKQKIYDRGYKGPDFVDLADAIVCQSSNLGTEVDLIAQTGGFPYQFSYAICPSN